MKWINENFLNTWSQSLTSRILLPELVKDLIIASLDKSQISQIRFPTKDSSTTPGYDGNLGVNIEGHSFIPNGTSVWEIKTSEKYEKEANEDFKKRSAEPLGVDKKSTTYVAVSSRKWVHPQKTIKEWIEEKKKQDSEWKDIRFIDAIALEQWLEFCPAVAARFAKLMGLSPQKGAQSIDEYWDWYTNCFNPALNEKVLLTDREKQAQKLIENLINNNSSVLKYYADSPREVIAFVAAVIRSADKEISNYLNNRTLILKNMDAADFFSNKERMIFIPQEHISPECGFLARKNNLIIPSGRKNNKEDSIRLERPTKFALAESLKSLGLSDEDARKISSKCGGSITILERRIPRTNSRKPDWDECDVILIPALLAGSWDERNEEDKKILALLAGVDEYDKYEEDLLFVLDKDDSPLEKVGTIWKIIAPVDVLDNFRKRISKNKFKILEKVGINIFCEIAPELSNANDNNYIFFFKKFKYSEWLRDGVATTLLLIAVLGREFELNTPNNHQEYVDQIIAKLPSLRENPRVMISLENQLPYLMEAAPDPFIEALEYMLKEDTDSVKQIFQERNSRFSGSPHTYLLWALEGLAWNPDYLKRVSLILARLAKIDPGGQLANRPINSLNDIFLTEHPCTNATLKQRLGVIDTLIKQEPEIAWNLLVRMMPKSKGFMLNTHKPLYREAQFEHKEKITWELVGNSYREVIRRVLELAGDSLERWKIILKALSYVMQDYKGEVISSLEAKVSAFNSDDKLKLWTILKDIVNLHRSYPHADWSMSNTDIENLDRLIAELEPHEKIDKIKWLFDEYCPPIETLDRSKRHRQIEKIREEAVSDLIELDGIDGVISLVERVKFPELLAQSFASCNENIDNFEEIMEKIFAIYGKNELINIFCQSLSTSFSYKYKKWKNIVKNMIEKNQWNNQQIANLIVGWSDIRETWDFAESLGEGVSDFYWRTKKAWADNTLNLVDLEFGAEKLLKHERAFDAIQFVHERASEIKPSLIFDILQAAIPEINSNSRSIDNMSIYYLEKIFETLRSRLDLETHDIAKLEYAYFPVLENTQPSLKIYDFLAQDPAFYVSLIEDAFKSENSEHTPPEEVNYDKPLAAFRLLSNFRKIPGASENEINSNELSDWINQVLNLAEKIERKKITQQYMGYLLAHAPEDSNDAVWPHIEIRNLIEKLDSDEIIEGIIIERHNMRGVYFKGINEGGTQERDLAQKYFDWAQKSGDWPRTQDMLNKIGQMWLMQGEDEDTRSKLNRMKDL